MNTKKALMPSVVRFSEACPPAPHDASLQPAGHALVSDHALVLAKWSAKFALDLRRPVAPT